MSTKSDSRDELWTEIRQLVLSDGPASESLDKVMEEEDIPDEAREEIVAQLIAMRLALIVRECDGFFKGAPPHVILGSWAASCLPQQIFWAKGDEDDE